MPGATMILTSSISPASKNPPQICPPPTIVGVAGITEQSTILDYEPTLSGKVYLIRLADGTSAALRLTNFMNDAAVKGFMTIDYLYPCLLYTSSW